MTYLLAALLLLLATVADAAPCLARITPGGSLAYGGNAYRLEPSGAILRNGATLGNGFGSVLLVTPSGELQTLGSDSRWWRWNDAWSATNAPDPCTAPVVVPPVNPVPPLPTLDRLGWDQNAPSLADAKGYTYKLYRDGSVYAIPLLGVSCALAAGRTTAPFLCTAAFPTTLLGAHTLRVSATSKAKIESEKSNVLKYEAVIKSSESLAVPAPK